MISANDCVDISAPNDESSYKDERCGLGSFRPRRLHCFARAKIFTFLYSVALVFQNAHFSYFFAIMSTLQRRFGLSGKLVAIILLAASTSPFIVSFFVGYYARNRSRPLMLFLGLFCLVISCVFSVAPYLIYGPGTHLLLLDPVESKPVIDLCPSVLAENTCNGEDTSTVSEAVVTVILFFIAKCLCGISYSIQYVVGNTYVDDSVKKKNSPYYFAYVHSFKLIGPSLGYLIASFCLKYYEDPLYDPGISTTDPRWIGAWWIGYIILGVALLVVSFGILLFPKYLPGARPQENTATSEMEGTLVTAKETFLRRLCSGLSNFSTSMRRLFKNPVYASRLIYWLLANNVTLGYSMMLPEYIEKQYGTSASEASILSGPALLFTNILGIWLGGLVLQFFKPRPRYITGYNAFCDILKLTCFVSAMFLGCGDIAHGSVAFTNEQGALASDCSQNCACNAHTFQPVCASDGKTQFFSACFAGCKIFDISGFSNCTCISKNMTTSVSVVDAITGLCDRTCQNTMVFVLITCLAGLITRTTIVGNHIFGLRCIDPKDKVMALGVQEGLSSIFTYIPYPLIYNLLFDSSCLIWENNCGQRKSCWLYDTMKLRHLFHGVSSAILCTAIVSELIMTYYSNRISGFYGDKPSKQSELNELSLEADVDKPMLTNEEIS